MPRRSLMICLLLAACSAAQVSLPVAPKIPTRVADTVKIVLIGDSGTFDANDTSTCSDPTTTATRMPSSCRDAALATFRRERPDAIVILGDLVYPRGPLCRRGRLTARARATLDRYVGDIARTVEVPLVLVLGNHDVWQSRAGLRAAEACYMAYARENPGIWFPRPNFVVDAGPATLRILDTTRAPSPALIDLLRRSMRSTANDWNLALAHHGWRTFGDKESQHRGREWSDAIGERPQFWLSGHAHFLQFGVYDGVAAATSGAFGKLRDRPACGPDGPACESDDLKFARSSYGYAVLELSATEAHLTFKNVQGQRLFEWTRTRTGDPAGQIVSLTPP